MRWTAADVEAAQARMRGAAEVPAPRRSKYRNVKVEWQGMTFDSKHELACWKALDEARALGSIRGLARQVSFQLPGTRRRTRVDFMVVELTGLIRWLDAKGFDTPQGKLKRDQVREAYGINIELC